MFNKQILQLPAHLLIGSGGVRRVYRHPSDEGKCIKITHNKSRSRAVFREISYLKNTRDKENHLSIFLIFTDSVARIWEKARFLN